MGAPSFVTVWMRPRSEVFALDLRHGDLIAFTDPDGTPWLFYVESIAPHPRDPLSSLLLTWRRVIDLGDQHTERARELRAQGHATALDEPVVFGVGDDHVYEIVGRNIVR